MKWKRCSERLSKLGERVWVHVPGMSHKQDRFIAALQHKGTYMQWQVFNDVNCQTFALAEVTLWAPIEEKK